MPPTAEDVTHAVLLEASGVLDQSVEKIRHCLEQLSDEQVWWRPHASLNSIGNLVLHLTGNVRQWMVSGIGGSADVRDRPAEFAQRAAIPKAQLLAGLKDVVDETKQVFGRATAADMLRVRRIQGFTLSGWGALFDSIPHFKGHTQEIISLTRIQLKDAYRFHWQPATAEQGAARG